MTAHKGEEMTGEQAKQPIDIDCPRCQAKAGQKCFEDQFGVYQHTFHNARIEAAASPDPSPTTEPKCVCGHIREYHCLKDGVYGSGFCTWDKAGQVACDCQSFETAPTPSVRAEMEKKCGHCGRVLDGSIQRCSNDGFCSEEWYPVAETAKGEICPSCGNDKENPREDSIERLLVCGNSFHSAPPQQATLPDQPVTKCNQLPPDPQQEIIEGARNIHNELLPVGYRFTPEDEKRLDAQDFHSHGEHKLPPIDITEADRFMAWRWYGKFYRPMREELLDSMAWRISRERQLLSQLSPQEPIEGEELTIAKDSWPRRWIWTGKAGTYQIYFCFDVDTLLKIEWPEALVSDAWLNSELEMEDLFHSQRKAFEELQQFRKLKSLWLAEKEIR